MIRNGSPGADAARGAGNSTASSAPSDEFQVLVRQVTPGKCVRTPFCRPIETAIPDIEAVLHAVFDLNSAGKPFTVADAAALAAKYEQGGCS